MVTNRRISIWSDRLLDADLPTATIAVSRIALLSLVKAISRNALVADGRKTCLAPKRGDGGGAHLVRHFALRERGQIVHHLLR